MNFLFPNPRRIELEFHRKSSGAPCHSPGPARTILNSLVFRRTGIALTVFIPLLFIAAHTPAAAVPSSATNGFWFADLSAAALRSGDPATRQFSPLPKGLQVFHDVPFRAGAPVVVTGIEAARGGDFFPPSV